MVFKCVRIILCQIKQITIVKSFQTCRGQNKLEKFGKLDQQIRCFKPTKPKEEILTAVILETTAHLTVNKISVLNIAVLKCFCLRKILFYKIFNKINKLIKKHGKH